MKHSAYIKAASSPGFRFDTPGQERRHATVRYHDVTPMPKKKSARRKLVGRAPKPAAGEEHLQRVRRICGALPDTTEKLSHGEPTFFVRKRVYCMFANNHHKDGHIAVWIAAAPGLQATLVRNEPQKFFRPPYVGPAGWIGIELRAISDEELSAHLLAAWRLIEGKQKSRRKRRSTP
jgi:hypothetical protein